MRTPQQLPFKTAGFWIGLAVLSLAAIAVALAAPAQSASTSQTPSLPGHPVVPQLMRYTGSAQGRAGDEVEATFRVYRGTSGGDPLWSETQRVTVGQDGRFSVLLGAATEGGLPQALFSQGQGQWLAVSIERGEEQPRVKLSSVAYAMKAADAETLGGLAATQFVTQAQFGATAQALQANTEALSRINPDTTPSGSGTTGTVPLWTGASTLGNSAITQTGTSTFNVGINTATPATTLDVKGAATVRGTLNLPPLGAATAGADYLSPMLELGASSYNSSTAAAVTNSYGWEAHPAGNNTSNPYALLDLYYIAGTAAPRYTGFSINPYGVATFVTGQKFPNTLNSVVAGTALTGGGSASPTTNSVTLNVDTTQVPLLASSNNFTGYQTFSNGDTVTGNEIVSGNSTVYGTLQAGTTSAPSYEHPDSDGVDALTDNGAAIYGFSYHGYGGIFQTNTTQGNPNYQPGTGYYAPSVEAINYGAGGGLLAANGGYGTAAFIRSDAQSSVSQNQIAKYAAALWADSGSMNGLIGSSDYYNGGSFFNNSNGYATVLAKNYNSGGITGLLAGLTGKDFGGVIRAEGNDGVCGISTAGDVSCTGELKALAATKGGARQVETYAVQSSESWLEDFGSGRLEHGSAVVQLDPTFADAANTGVEYHVFLTPKGDAGALFVTNETASGFEVRESAHGADSIAFDYRIVAKRKGHETERLVDVTERFVAEKTLASKAPAPPENEGTLKRTPLGPPLPHHGVGTARPANHAEPKKQ